MYRSVYGQNLQDLGQDYHVVEIHRTVSLDEGLDSLSEVESKDDRKVDEAYEYLKATFGDNLSNILTECTTNRPDDPILYIALLLER